MLSPSAAPRWKITTSRLLRVPLSVAPNAARVRKLGIVAVPTTASALLRRKTRRVMDIETSLPSLELRRTKQQTLDHGSVGCVRSVIQLALCNGRILQACCNRVVRLLRNISNQQCAFQIIQNC